MIQWLFTWRVSHNIWIWGSISIVIRCWMVLSPSPFTWSARFNWFLEKKLVHDNHGIKASLIATLTSALNFRMRKFKTDDSSLQSKKAMKGTKCRSDRERELAIVLIAVSLVTSFGTFLNAFNLSTMQQTGTFCKAMKTCSEEGNCPPWMNMAWSHFCIWGQK